MRKMQRISSTSYQCSQQVKPAVIQISGDWLKGTLLYQGRVGGDERQVLAHAGKHLKIDP